MGIQPWVAANRPSGKRYSLPRWRRISGPAPIVCALLVMIIAFCSCSAATIQSQGTRSYKAGHTYAANYAAAYRVSLKQFCRDHKVECPDKETGPIIYPASSAQKWCTILMSDETSFKGNREDWVAGCVNSSKGARFVDPTSNSSGTLKLKTWKTESSSNTYTITIRSH
jgi:hypothetical protein